MKIKLDNKVEILIEPRDVWNLDTTLALIIFPALIQLKAIKQGVPSEFVDVGGSDWEMQDSFDFYKETNDDAFSSGVENWYTVLDKMIWSFYQLSISNYAEKYSGDNFDPVGQELHEERIQEGLDLFAKHYVALWD